MPHYRASKLIGSGCLHFAKPCCIDVGWFSTGDGSTRQENCRGQLHYNIVNSCELS